MLYWPMAIAKGPERMVTLFTNEGYLAMEEAKGCIEAWKKDNELEVYFAYVHDNDNHIIYYENNMDYMGKVNYERNHKFDFSDGTSEFKGQRGM